MLVTLTQDIRWRRNAFSIQEYVDLTDEFKIRFVASDSLRPGQEYDGGSLIEAAVDDLLILDLASLDVSEADGDQDIIAWPIPARDRLHSAGWAPGSSVELLDASGRLVLAQAAGHDGQVHLTLPTGMSGTAVVKGTSRTGQVRVKKVVLASE